MTKILTLALPIIIGACTGKTGGEDKISKEDKVKLEQYIVEGEQHYIQYCSACHQRDGKGLAQLYPPIQGSDFLEDNLEGVICNIKNGMSGPITVNGVEYNQIMPPIPTITPLEIAEITTYVYNSWGRSEGLVPVTDVEKILKGCAQSN